MPHCKGRIGAAGGFHGVRQPLSPSLCPFALLYLTNIDLCRGHLTLRHKRPLPSLLTSQLRHARERVVSGSPQRVETHPPWQRKARKNEQRKKRGWREKRWGQVEDVFQFLQTLREKSGFPFHVLFFVRKTFKALQSLFTLQHSASY